MKKFLDFDSGIFLFLTVISLFAIQSNTSGLLGAMRLSSGDSLAMKVLHSATSMTVHGSCSHAILNAIGFFCIMRGIKIRKLFVPILVSFLSAMISTILFAYYAMPIHSTLVGSSGVLFALCGWWAASNPKSIWCFAGIGRFPAFVAFPILVSLDSLISIFVFTNHAWQIHSASFALSASVIIFAKKLFSVDFKELNCNDNFVECS
jgi:hypothetical protein